MSRFYLPDYVIDEPGTVRYYLPDHLVSLSGAVVDTTAPTINQARPVYRILPRTPFTLTLTADEAVTWTKQGGVNQGLFTLTDNVLTLPAQGPRLTRVVTVRATDAAGNFSDYTVTVVTTDYKRRSRGI